MNIYPTHFVLGPKEVPITIMMYGDFRCQTCAWWYPRIKEILADFPQQVQLVFRPYVLAPHRLSYQAAKAAYAAGAQGKYYDMADVLFEYSQNQDLNENKFTEYARLAGCSTEQFNRDFVYSDIQWREQIRTDKKAGDEFEADGTPSFYINDQRVHPIDVKEFKKLINDYLSGKVPH